MLFNLLFRTGAETYVESVPQGLFLLCGFEQSNDNNKLSFV